MGPRLVGAATLLLTAVASASAAASGIETDRPRLAAAPLATQAGAIS